MEAWTTGPWVGHKAFTVKGMAVMRPPLLIACTHAQPVTNQLLQLKGLAQHMHCMVTDSSRLLMQS